MRILHHSKVDLKRWDELVLNSHQPWIYNTSFYFQATAEDWYIYLADDYSFGVAFGVAKRLGIKSVYPPFFQRFISPVGDMNQWNPKDFIITLQDHFSYGTLYLSPEMDTSSAIQRSYQVISKADFKLKTLAKRMLKKGHKFGFEIEEISPDKAIPTTLFIINQLSEKLKFYATKEAKKLLTLASLAAEKQQLKILGIFNAQRELLGAVLGLVNEERLIYLKGACNSETKQNGGMYLLVHELIEYAHSRNLLFDFGGSSVEEVRYFNTRFSGEDSYYSEIHWNNSPFWFKTMQKLRKH